MSLLYIIQDKVSLTDVPRSQIADVKYSKEEFKVTHQAQRHSRSLVCFEFENRTDRLT